MITIEMNRVAGDYGFEAKDANGHLLMTDISEDTGGQNAGIRPMQLLLMALGGCSSIDVVSILKKQRQTIERLSMKIEGEREKGKEPALWESINIEFILKGKIDSEKLEKACTLSIEKYCSVAETLRRSGTKITWKAILNND